MLPHVQADLDKLRDETSARDIVVDESVGTVSIVGEGVQRETGIAARMFSALGLESINIDLISTSNLMITCVVPKDQLQHAVQAVHAEFMES